MSAARLTRFAPSPTGYLHLGHVAHMLYVWGAAQSCDAEVLLRMEDHDRGRCRPEYEAAILEDMAALGFQSSNALDAVSQYRQSDCADRYEEALHRLKQTSHVYFCTCTRKQLADRVPPGEDGERAYDGFCRHRGNREGSLRLELGEGSVTFTDGVLGEQTQYPRLQCGDLLLRDRSGQWTYQFAVTVDDIVHGVDLVVRGEDLFSSTGRQLRLAQLLGRQEPVQFLHHPLIRDDSGLKLSKKTAAAPIREMRQAGQSANAILGAAAHAVGLTEQDAPQELNQLLDLTAAALLRQQSNRQHQQNA